MSFLEPSHSVRCACFARLSADGGEPGESSAEPERARDKTHHVTQRFEHYELVSDKDGKPLELGRGAMGVTYKAFDVDLRCPVTLKVISEKYLGDESAQLRFLREARAAASLRHSNVASVLHLGRTGSSYFYAMEFVAGETLEKLIRRSGRLEVKIGAGNCDASRSGFGCSAQAEARSPGHQTKQYHGESGGGRCRDRKNHRPGPRKGGQRTRFSNRDFNTRALCWNAGVRQPRAICRSRRGHSFGSLLTGRDALGNGDRPCAVQGVHLLR